MSSYSFSTVDGVLPLGVQRVYVPRAARPHLCWVAPVSTSSSNALGEHSRLKGDGTAARETWAAQEERDRGDEEPRGNSDASPSPVKATSDVALRALLTTDAATGTQLTLYHDVAAPHAPVCSAAIPSQRRVVSLWSPACSEAEGVDSLLSGDLPLYVSDEVGNIFHHSWAAQDGTREPAAKRHRADGAAASEGVDAWTAVVAAHSHLPSCVAAPSPSGALDGLFAVARGAAGWAGLTALNADGGFGAELLVSAREFYRDVRVVDAARHEVVRAYGTTHTPTGLLSPSVQAAPHCVLVTEGCLATLFDVRCPSAVLSLGEVYAAQAEWTAAREAAAAEKAQQEQQAGVEGAQASSEAKKSDGAESSATGGKTSSPSPPPLPPLVPGRLTSTVGQVRDACATANPFEVACAVDRALCVYDLRKFNRLFTSSSVLKYVIRGVTSIAGGRGVVCSGIDSEVRLVPLYDKAGGAAQETLSLAARAVAQSQKKKNQRSDAVKKAEEGSKVDGAVASPSSPSSPVFDVDTMGPGGTFRTRLNTSVSCTSVWQGGWVTSQNLNGVAALGISVDGEVFVAQ